MSTPFRLILCRSIYEAMLAQARAEYPNECVGLLAGCREGDVGRVERRYPLVNALASPVEFEGESRSHFTAQRDIDARGLDILAVYHSHPTSEPLPSRKDRERSCSPDVVNLIISLQTSGPPVRGWWLTAESAAEADWEIVEEG